MAPASRPLQIERRELGGEERHVGFREPLDGASAGEHRAVVRHAEAPAEREPNAQRVTVTLEPGLGSFPDVHVQRQGLGLGRARPLFPVVAPGQAERDRNHHPVHRDTLRVTLTLRASASACSGVPSNR